MTSSFSPGSWEQLFATPYSPGAAITIVPMHDVERSELMHLTFTSCRSILETAAGQNTEEAGELSLVALADGKPVGMVLAEKMHRGDADSTADRKSVLLRSVFTNVLWQQKGIGKALLASLAEAARKAGCPAIHTQYSPLLPSLKAFERLLSSSGWEPPEPYMEESSFWIKEMAAADWLSKVPAPPSGYELVSFPQLTGNERQELETRLRSGALPQGLSPFAEEEHLIPELSVALRCGDGIVAWMSLIRSPVVKDAICYRSLYVEPALRTANGLGPIVAAEAVRRHAASTVAAERPKGVFNTSHSATKQMNFVRKRLLPACYETFALNSSMLELQTTQPNT